MRNIQYIILFLFCYQGANQCFANNSADSLLTLINKSSQDGTKADLYYKLGNVYKANDNEAQLIAYLKAEKIFSRITLNPHRVLNEVELAKYYVSQGQLSSSEKYYLNAIENAKKLKNLELEFQVIGSYLDDFININSPVKTLELLFDIKERIILEGNKKLLFGVYDLISDQYLVLGTKMDLRRQYSDSMIIIAKELNDTIMLRTAYFSIAVSSPPQEAIDNYKIALNHTNRKLNKTFLSSVFNNMSGKYRVLREFQTSLNYADSAYKISKEVGRIEGMAAAKYREAEAYCYLSKFNEGIKSGKEGLKLFQKAGILRRQSSCAYAVSYAYRELGNFEEALVYYEMSIKLKDSLEQITQAGEAEFVDRKFSYDLAMKRDSVSLSQERTVNKLKLATKDSQLEKERMQRYVLYGGILVIILFSILIWIGFQRKRKANVIIGQQKLDVERQKEEIEQQHLEMTESITYAKRIQSAILPPDKVVKEYLKDSFILYKPKDIVAGDFYWMEHKDAKVLFAAADCTGHGVPGAMVSVVCNNALNRSVREHGLTDPGKILDKTRKIVIEEFEKSDEDVKDGMDIAICSIEGDKLEYAGAHNPLWIIRDGELIETKADKQPIGKFDNPIPYTTHSFKLEKGDSIYIFSDGYVDQFGGENEKKFKISAFRELLQSIQDKTMQEQKAIIDETFEAWRGDLEQIDDVCVIGVRV